MIALKIGAGLLLGGFGGFIYQRFVGCRTGGCPITSNATASTLYGAMIGLYFAMA